MIGAVITIGSVTIMVASGIAVSGLMNFLHTYEFDMSKKQSKKGGNLDGKVNDLGRKIRREDRF